MYTKYFKIALLVFSLSVNQSYCAKIGSNNERDVNGSFVDEYEMESFLRSLTDNANGTDGSITNEVIRRWPKRVIQRMQELIQGKQMPPLSPNPIQSVTNRIPCTCKNGLCGCCTGGMLAYFNSKGCMKLKYIPEDFSFEFKMMMNDVTLYKNKVSGKNPRPICKVSF